MTDSSKYLLCATFSVLLASACTVEDQDDFTEEDRQAVLQIDQAGGVVLSLADCMTDMQACVAAAGANPFAAAACAAEAALCVAGEAGGGALPPLPIDPTAIDVTPIFDCQVDLGTCMSAATTQADIAMCLADLQLCTTAATADICDAAADLCMSLPAAVPECDILDLACV